MKAIRFELFNKILILAFLLHAIGAEVAMGNGGCLDEHFKLAGDLNKARAKTYSQLSGGASKSISRNLIWFEGLGRIFSVPFLESKAQIYWEKGINVVCDELGDMASVPPQQLEVKVPSDFSVFYPLDAKSIAQDLLADLKREDYVGMSQHSGNLASKLSEHPQYHCLTRHFLESIRKVASHANDHRVAALKLGLRDPKKLINKYLKLQVRSLYWTVHVDKKAAPLQAKGLEIICRDIPAIPL